MADFGINEMPKMQKASQEKYKDKRKPVSSEAKKTKCYKIWRGKLYE